MRVSVKTALVLLIAIGFLLPGVVALGNEVEDEQSPKETAEISLPYLGSALKVSIHDPQPLRLARADRDVSKNECRFFPGVTPFLSDMEPLTRSTRGRDVWMKDVELTTNPGTPNSLGTKEKKSTFTVTVQNNGTLGDVIVRFKAVQHPLEEGDKLDDMPIEYKEEQTKSSAGNKAEDTVTFDWTPSVGSLFVLNFTAFEPGDPDDTNNHRYWYGWVNAWGDPCDAAGTSDFSPVSGNFHVADAHNDPAADHHSSPKVWAHWNDVTHNYAAGNNSMDTPMFTVNDFHREYVIWYSNIFSGSLGATDTHTVLISWDGNNWRPTAEVDATANAQVSTDWFHFIVEDGAPGMYLNYRDVLNTIGFRLCVGLAGGPAVKGYMFDDMEVFGVQNFTGIEDFAQITKTAIKLEQIGSPLAIDGNDNGAIEFSGEPGDELTFQFKVTNEGSAPINKIEFEVTNKPEDWTLEDVDVPADMTYTTRSLFLKTDIEEFDIKITIPEDARASVDFSEDIGDEDMKFNPYLVGFSVKAYGVAPEVGQPDPSPAEDMETGTVEAIVDYLPSIEVSIGTDNLTGNQGDQLEYSINIENTGNCNLTDDIEAEITITVEDKPPGQWTVNLGKSTLDILEYEEDEDVSVKVNIPATEKAGFYEVEIQVTLGDFESPDPIIITAGVEQFYGLEMDFKDRNAKSHEVDPTQSNQVRKEIVFEVANKGNGYDTAIFEVNPDNKDDKGWFDLDEEDSVELDPVGGLRDEKEFTIVFTVPEDAVHGDHKFTVKAVSANDETGDTETEEKEIVFTIFRPDLQVSSDIKLDPAVPVMGEETEIEVRIFNNGTTSATSFSVYLYINEALVDFRSVNILQKGQLTDLPPFLYVFDENKEYNIKVKVDPAELLGKGNVSEMDETNNEASWTIIVIAPDIEWDKEYEFTVDAGTELLMPNEMGNYDIDKSIEHTFTFKVKNDGEADASNIRVNFKVYYTDEFGDYKVFEDNDTVNSLKMGKSTDVQFAWLPESDLWSTEYFFVLAIDPDETVPESDDSNNDWEPNVYFVTEKKPENGPGFEVLFLVGALMLVGAVLYRRRR